MERLNPFHPVQQEKFAPELWKTNHDNQVTRALSKFKAASDSSWHGFVTPTEILLLDDLGYLNLPMYDHYYILIWAMENKSKGKSNPRYVCIKKTKI